MVFRSGLGLVLAALVASAACGDDDGSISGVVPGDVFAGRSTNVLISGSGTDWSDGVAVDFGPGITAGAVVVASPTALWIPITVSPDAALGPRTVEVDGLTFEDAFSVISPLKVKAIEGTEAQGSLVRVSLVNLDFVSPFDRTSEGGFFEPLTFPNIAVGTPSGTAAIVTAVDAYTMELLWAIDVDAAPGPLAIDVVSGPPGSVDVVGFTLPAAFDIAARTAVELQPGQVATGALAQPFDSALYKLSNAELAVARTSVVTSNPDAAPTIMVLGSTGSFAELLDEDDSVVARIDGDVYAIVVDFAGAAGVDYELRADRAIFGTATAEEGAGDNNSRANAEVITVPLKIDASLSSDTDEDWYKVVIDAADSGKSLAVATISGGASDTVIDVLADDGTTSILEFGREVDRSFDEVTMTAPLAAGTYYVRILNTHEFVSQGFLPKPGPYLLAVGLTGTGTTNE
jgi:hypothetical protein